MKIAWLGFLRVLKKVEEYICFGPLFGIQFFFHILKELPEQEASFLEGGKSCWEAWVADAVEVSGLGGGVEQ